MRTLRILPAAAFFAALPMLAADPPKVAPAEDLAFVKEASQGNMTEVALGRLAAEKGTDPQVKKFGQEMVKDHTKAQKNLHSAATKEGISKEVPGALDSEHQEAVDKFSKLSGAEFDTEYKKDMLEDHEKDVAAFEKQSHGTTQIGKFASDTLPTLQHHLKMAQEMSGSKMNGSK